MEESAYKYTDSQVRADIERYRSVASEYLRNYSGEFELLLDYRHRLGKGIGLTVPMIRATLNCMRFDAQWDDRLPSRRARNVEEETNTVYVDFDQKKKIKPYHSYNITALRWNMPYGISSNKMARTVHLVAQDSGWLYYMESREWFPRIRWNCKAFYNMPGQMYAPLIELMSEEDALSMTTLPGWKLCGTCQKIAR
jgi:hypothetical protein